MDLPQRKQIRLRTYDYSTPGAYFLTLCTRDKQMLFWQMDAYGETGEIAPSVDRIVGQLKRWASKEAGFPIWQKSFYDHVIRNENDYREVWSYIDANPASWQKDCASID